MNGLKEKEAVLYKRTDIDETHFFVAVPDQHWTVGMDKMQLENLAQRRVPIHTRFTKLPYWNAKSSKEEIIEGLREQLDYWETQMASKQANQMNALSGVVDEDFEAGKNTDSYYRYQKRAEACCHFLDELQENPRIDDVKIFNEHYTEVSYPNES